MVNSITEALVIQFQDQVHLEAGQGKSRLRGLIKEVSVTGNQYAYESLKRGTLPTEITARFSDTVAQERVHSRREIKMRDYAETLTLEEFDDLQTLIDPAREYAASVASVMMNQYDKLAIEAAVGSVKTGRNFGTTVSYTADGGSTIAANSTGLTYAKLLQVKENFINNEVGVDMDEEILLLVTGKQHSDMMQEVELTSGDFRRDSVIENGKITSALGMKIITYGTGDTNFLNISGGVRDCIAMSNRAVCVGVNKDIGVKINERPDKNNAQQIQARFFLGATRAEGKLVQKVQCAE